MPVDQPSPEMQEATQKLYDLAVELTNDCLICSSDALVLTKRRLELFSKPSSAESIDVEAIIEIFINYRYKPKYFNQFEIKAMLGNALIIRVLGSEAANRIGQAYIEWQGHARPMCTAFLMWVGDNPELAEIEGKIFLDPNLVESLLIEASGYLTQRIQLSNPAYELRKRLRLELLSPLQVPNDIQLALNQDKKTFGESLTYQKLMSELQFISSHVEEGDIKNRVDSLLFSLVAKMNE